MTKRIVLCADDYGQAPEISRGIVTLIHMGRVTATSCLMNTPYWTEHAKWLLPCQDFADIGLHFNLTDGRALSSRFQETYGEHLWPLGTLIKKSLLRQIDQAVIEAELEAQLDAFTSAMNRAPDFLDGHQHVHQFPIVREALVAVYKKQFNEQGSYVRLVNEPIKPWDFLIGVKKVIIQALGTRAMQKLLQANHIPHNTSFAGIYAFGNTTQYGKLFPAMLREIQDKGILMCHPAMSADIENDKIGAARFKEYQYIAGDHFLLDCGRERVTLTRFLRA